jgi:SAM-dependent methyltransferase
MEPNTQQELMSQECIDLWRGIYARKQMTRLAPYWAYDREGDKIPITVIVDTVNPTSILDYGSGNGRGAGCLRTHSQQGLITVTCYDPAWPGFEQVPTGEFDLVIAYNLLNNVEAPYRLAVCSHIESLVGKDLIVAIIVPNNEDSRSHKELINMWRNYFPGLKLSYSSAGHPERTVGLKERPITFVPLFLWFYRDQAEVVPPVPRVRVKKKGT